MPQALKLPTTSYVAATVQQQSPTKFVKVCVDQFYACVNNNTRTRRRVLTMHMRVRCVSAMVRTQVACATTAVICCDVQSKRYSSCRYNERQLIDVTAVRRVRPRAERSCTNE